MLRTYLVLKYVSQTLCWTPWDREESCSVLPPAVYHLSIEIRTSDSHPAYILKHIFISYVEKHRSKQNKTVYVCRDPQLQSVNLSTWSGTSYQKLQDQSRPSLCSRGSWKVSSSKNTFCYCCVFSLTSQPALESCPSLYAAFTCVLIYTTVAWLYFLCGKLLLDKS